MQEQSALAAAYLNSLMLPKLSGVKWFQPDMVALCTSKVLYFTLTKRSLVNAAFLQQQQHLTELMHVHVLGPGVRLLYGCAISGMMVGLAEDVQYGHFLPATA